MKQEANATILDLNETTTRYIANKYEPKNKDKILETKIKVKTRKEKEHRKRTKGREQKSNQ